MAKHSLPTHRLLIPITAWNIDGTPNQEGKITTYARLNFFIGEREYTERFLVTDLGDTPLILGLPWLQKNNPTINWAAGTVSIRKLRLNSAIDKDYLEGGALGPKLVIAKTTLATELAQRQKKEDIPLEERIPREYHSYLSVFDKRAAEHFPPSRPYDHAIELKKDFVPRDCKVYPMSQKEQMALDEFLEENLRKGYIRPSKSPMASPFFFVAKKDGSLRPCQDY